MEEASLSLEHSRTERGGAATAESLRTRVRPSLPPIRPPMSMPSAVPVSAPATTSVSLGRVTPEARTRVMARLRGIRGQ